MGPVVVAAEAVAEVMEATVVAEELPGASVDVEPLFAAELLATIRPCAAGELKL